MSFSIYSVQAEILDFSYMDLPDTEYKRNELYGTLYRVWAEWSSAYTTGCPLIGGYIYS